MPRAFSPRKFMIPAILSIGSFGLPTISFFLFFGFLLFLFLFWRAAKNEFVDEEIVFDTLVICLVSSLLFARIFEFMIHSVIYKWSFANFFFLNTISGLSLWGAILGSIFSGIMYLKNKKYNFWQIFDLAAAPLFLFLAIYNLGLFLGSKNLLSDSGYLKDLPNSLFSAILFFMLFWILKRLEKQKKHVGFFASFFIVFFSLVNLTVFYLGKTEFLEKTESADFFNLVS